MNISIPVSAGLPVPPPVQNPMPKSTVHKTQAQVQSKPSHPGGYLTSLVACDLGIEEDGDEEDEGKLRFSDSVKGPNDCIYGIPYEAGRVVKFNPLDNSMTEIGPELEDGKWDSGVLSDNGNVYCLPCSQSQQRQGPGPEQGVNIPVLKIDTSNDNVTIIDAQCPEPNRSSASWCKGALAEIDKCIYYLPNDANRILKLDPDNEESLLSSVGVDDLPYNNYSSTVAGTDNFLYGLPYKYGPILRFDPANENVSYVGGANERDNMDGLMCSDGVMGRDGRIYAYSDNQFPPAVLEIDIVDDSYVLHPIIDFPEDYEDCEFCWGGPLLGSDGCIYFPPCDAFQVLKFDPISKISSLVGEDFGDETNKWTEGSVVSGVIYCLPSSPGASEVLVVSPFREFKMMISNAVTQNPKDIGLELIFKKNQCIESSLYESAVMKFGLKEVFRVIEECISSNAVSCERSRSNLQIFIIAASNEYAVLALVYSLFRENLDTFLSMIANSLITRPS